MKIHYFVAVIYHLVGVLAMPIIQHQTELLVLRSPLQLGNLDSSNYEERSSKGGTLKPRYLDDVDFAAANIGVPGVPKIKGSGGKLRSIIDALGSWFKSISTWIVRKTVNKPIPIP
ncbi:hypothetical protein FRC03_001538 [Tulasnella sp. 419]|nr:hypothetical protein FRC03_001538 [Tulasnella sp. 419]